MKFYTETNIEDMLEGCKTLDAFKAKLIADDNNNLESDVLDVMEGEVIVVSFPSDRTEDAIQLTKLLQNTYQNNPVIGVINDIDVMIEQADEALEMLDGMKAKISILKDTPSNKIII